MKFNLKLAKFTRVSDVCRMAFNSLVNRRRGMMLLLWVRVCVSVAAAEKKLIKSSLKRFSLFRVILFLLCLNHHHTTDVPASFVIPFYISFLSRLMMFVEGFFSSARVALTVHRHQQTAQQSSVCTTQNGNKTKKALNLVAHLMPSSCVYRLLVVRTRPRLDNIFHGLPDIRPLPHLSALNVTLCMRQRDRMKVDVVSGCDCDMRINKHTKGNANCNLFDGVIVFFLFQFCRHHRSTVIPRNCPISPSHNSIGFL